MLIFKWLLLEKISVIQPEMLWNYCGIILPELPSSKELEEFSLWLENFWYLWDVHLFVSKFLIMLNLTKTIVHFSLVLWYLSYLILLLVYFWMYMDVELTLFSWPSAMMKKLLRKKIWLCQLTAPKNYKISLINILYLRKKPKKWKINKWVDI